MSTIKPGSKIRVGLSSNGMLMTPEEFDAITRADERFRYELIHGVLIVTRLPLPAESDPNEELGYLLRRYKDDDPRGSVLDATLAERYVYTKENRRRADRLIWAGLGRPPDLRKDVPTIVVEFVSKGKRDRQRDYEEKKTEYLGIGVVEYWIVDRFHRIMTVHRRTPDGPVEQVVKEQEVYRTDVLPGFGLPLARLFVLADRWKRKP
jgi:Uma2 family endonuclease